MPSIICCGFKRARDFLNSLKTKRTKPDSEAHETVGPVEVVPKEIKKLPILVSDIKEILGLSEDNNQAQKIWKLKKKDIIPVPQSVHDSLDLTEGIQVRLRIGIILQSCVSIEQEYIAATYPTEPARPARPVRLVTKSRLEMEVKYQGEDRLLKANSDFSIWYSYMGMSTNFVICAAEDPEPVSCAVTRCLAYMGMIHNICKQEGRTNTIVYGCVSDGDQFTFLRIDNEDKYSTWTSPHGWYTNTSTSNKIWTHLVRITKSASALSPMFSRERRREELLDTSPGQRDWRLQFASSMRSEDEWNFSISI